MFAKVTMTRRLAVLAFAVLAAVCGCAFPPTAPAPAPAPVAAAASSAEGVLRAAIASRAAVAFVYSGVSRVALPHRLGASAAGNGKTLVRAWEVTRGDAPTGQWKLYDLAKISDPRLLPGAPFAPAPGYTPADRAIPAPTAEVPAPPAR